MKRDVFLRIAFVFACLVGFGLHAETPSLSTIKLSPKMRVVHQQGDSNSISLEKIRPFLDKTRIMPAEGLDGTPYVLNAGEDRFLAGVGDTISVKGVLPDHINTFDVYRMGAPLALTDTDEETIGYQVEYIATVNLIEKNQPSRFLVTASRIEIMPGDRLIPSKTYFGGATLTLTQPRQAVLAKIVGVNDESTLNGGLTQIGTHQVVILSAGKNQGVNQGNRLSVYQHPEPVQDPVHSSDSTECAQA